MHQGTTATTPFITVQYDIQQSSHLQELASTEERDRTGPWPYTPLPTAIDSLECREVQVALAFCFSLEFRKSQNKNKTQTLAGCLLCSVCPHPPLPHLSKSTYNPALSFSQLLSDSMDVNNGHLSTTDILHSFLLVWKASREMALIFWKGVKGTLVLDGDIFNQQWLVPSRESFWVLQCSRCFGSTLGSHHCRGEIIVQKQWVCSKH